MSMIKSNFLDLMASQKYCIGGILHEVLKIETYKCFFGEKVLNIKYDDFKPLGDLGTSTKVKEFIDKYQDSPKIVGPLNFIEYLTYHNSDNVLKLVIESKVTPGVNHETGLDLFKEMLSKFRDGFFDEKAIPYVSSLSSIILADTSYTPVLGREKELHELSRQFGKLMKNNVVLTGSGGVGKTALVEEFAYRHKGSYTVYELNVLGLISKGKEAPGILENILETLSNINGQKVLFIDEFHILAKEGLADTIKRITSRSSDLKFIVATTTDEFKLFIEKDKALERRFYPIPITEIQGETLKIVLEAWVDKLSSSFEINYEEDIIDFVIDKMAVERQKTSPDKEKDILDAAFSGCKLDGEELVTRDSVADVMAMRLSIPKKQLTSSMFDVIANLEEDLKSEIKGQDFAIKNIVRVIESSQMIKKKNKPMSVMFFAGPTSVGKTEMARQLAKIMFGSEKNLIQVDCTNFKEQHTVSSLLGSPPGYVGSEDGGKLINDVKQKPFSVILFDEFEKAHKDIHDIMLPMFEEGVLKDRLGREVSVSNCIIILTSNIGADIDSKKKGSAQSIGFTRAQDEEQYDSNQASTTERYKHYLKNLKNKLKPELIARINEIVIFETLNKSVIKDIVSKQLTESFDYYNKEYGFDISFSDDIVDFITSKSQNNPRKIATAIDKYIQSVITKAFIRKQIVNGSEFRVFMAEKVVALEVFEDEESSEINE